MAKAEQLKALISSHLKNDENRFVAIALQMAASEAKKGNSNLAREIRDLIDTSAKQSIKVVSISNDLSELVQHTDVAKDASSLIVSNEIWGKISRIVSEFHQSEKLKKHGLSNRRKILLAGPPGTGKTMTASVLAAKTGLPFYTVQIDRLVTKYLGETSAKLRQIFSMIRERPGVYLFDEFDAIATQRGLENEVGEMRRVLNSLLQFIEADESNSLIVAATNSLHSIDLALFRRFDDILSYEKPQKAEVVSLLQNRLGVFLGKYSLEKVASTANGLSHAEISQACDDAIKGAILSDQSKVTQKRLLDMVRDRKGAYSNLI
ncbi:AAA ATPase, central domain protein [Pseudovibrio sp. FO-BEG1]|uniref:AAA family ATPase n=1 Tax=Pseudovibrio sp. (strain FO-BEG1) TaxID=911045 RepID=UPI000238D21A|nr:ATP-binding protein [Pseudovibrio sp. FO-BEG1]AEV38692.1 AAA ATPase, central domain protein [Pseudovibrio sp. FO-BEG1]